MENPKVKIKNVIESPILLIVVVILVLGFWDLDYEIPSTYGKRF